MISLNAINLILPQCCEADAISSERLSEGETEHLSGFMPNLKTVLVFAHNVKHSLEWTWFPFVSSSGGSECAADLHLTNEIQNVINMLNKNGHQCLLLPYPGKCGVRFKDLADKTGMGKIGDNFLFLHREWGPWTHLRVLLTDKEIIDSLMCCDEVCTHCGICKHACPANAIQHEELRGNDCSSYQHSLREASNAYECQCEICIRACPIGIAPKPIQIAESD